MKKNLENTAAYDESVAELEALLIEGAVDDSHQKYSDSQPLEPSLSVNAMQESILAKTQNMPQYKDSEVAEASPDNRSIWTKLGLIPWRPGMRLSGLITAALLLGVVFVNQAPQAPSSAPDIVTPIIANEDPDLTFQELWLSEDEILFSEVL